MCGTIGGTNIIIKSDAIVEPNKAIQITSTRGRFYFYRNTAGTNSINLPNGVYQITLSGGQNKYEGTQAQPSSINGVVNGYTAAGTFNKYSYTGSGTINFNLGNGDGEYILSNDCNPTEPGATNCQFGHCTCIDKAGDGSIKIESIN